MASSERDWVAWHEPYDQPGSSLARRLEVVQDRIPAAVEQAPPRHRKSPDLPPTTRACFTESGFEEVGFDSAVDTKFGVGTTRLAAPPQPFEPGIRLFDFTGDGRASNL